MQNHRLQPWELCTWFSYGSSNKRKSDSLRTLRKEHCLATLSPKSFIPLQRLKHLWVHQDAMLKRGSMTSGQNASNPDVADGGPLFLEILKNWKEESDKKIIQSQIVSFYFKLFENLKDNQIIQRSMDIIKQDMFQKFLNGSSEKLEDFKKLIQIPVDNLKVQRKAISELIKVMNDLSPKSNLRKRKRSQNLFRGRRASK
ncbi:interferon gamma precursor [Camelus ferus]|nr:interferon gamma precursor [Camelus ferus]